MRSKLRHLFLQTAGMFAQPKNGIHILNGHFISRETKDASVFYEMLQQLQKKVDFIRIEEAVALIKQKKQVERPLVAFTFDDGYEECYTKIAPVLTQFQTNAAFFINPNFIECNEQYKADFLSEKVLIKNKNPMDWEMVKSLHKDGFVIGAHTLDHVRLNIDDKDILTEQLIGCKKIIEQRIGNKCEYFAYPYGQITDISPIAIKIAEETYQYIFTGCNHKKYMSFDNKAINRRHFEGDWSIEYMKYFLSYRKFY